MRCVLFPILLLSIVVSLFSQSLVINEVMSSNSSTIEDLDGEHPDWIELYNNSDDAINLDGYGITDDPDEPIKWVFPDITIAAHGHMLLFASDKDIAEVEWYWETVVDWGDVWHYRVFECEPSPLWTSINYSESGWVEGESGFGYGDDDDATILPQVLSVHLRKVFILENVDQIQSAILHVDFDDGFAAYLNGTQIAQIYLESTAFNQTAMYSTEAQLYQGGLPTAIEVDPALLQEGENVLAIQVHNSSTISADLTMIPFLSLKLAELPQNPHGANPVLPLDFFHLHTNFKISAEGEAIALTAPDGTLLDEVELGCLATDISFGRQPDGDDAWYYFSEATPRTVNDTQGFLGVTNDVAFSQPGGLYNGSQQITLSAESNATIHYTLDGSCPADTCEVYSGPIDISETTVVRARAYQDGCIPGSAVTQTFLIDAQHVLPIVSISTHPDNFFDWETGIYVMGPDAEPVEPYYGANFWHDWEKPINIEFYEPDGVQAFNITAGVKIFGNWTRVLPQKSLAVFARSCYGCSELDYQLFDSKPIDTFESFLLRNSGNDWANTLIRDALMTGLVADLDIEVQAYRPSVMYLNGEYWGIHNLREKVNEHFLESNCGVDCDHVDILEQNGLINEGSNEHYLAMMDYISTHDLSDHAAYEYVGTQMEISNFITYEVAEIFYVNTDWPAGNIRYWRPQVDDGRWRWILYDTDFGFGRYSDSAYMNNTLEYATDPNSSETSNPPWSTFLLRSLLENESFQNDFINRFCDLMNSNFAVDRMIEHIESKTNTIESEIPNQRNRWGDYYLNWDENIDRLIVFAENRSIYMKQHLKDYFDLEDMQQLSLGVTPCNAGSVTINTIEIESFPWQGEYFPDVPITLTANPSSGYVFSGWGGLDATEQTITISLTEALTLTALFELAEPQPELVCLNEINYNSSDDFNPEDWVEIHNAGLSAINISGWKFKDEEDDHVFTFVDDTLLGPGEYLVLCADSDQFLECFPNVANLVGNMDFGLSGGGELLRLYDAGGNLIDCVEYDDGGDWPSEPDGDGATLELIDPDYENSLAASWAASKDHGSPGEQNSCDVAVGDDVPPSQYMISNYPNPFNPSTTFVFSLPESGIVEITLFNPKGQKVKTLFREKLSAGNHEIEWDGLDSSGKNVASGVYLYRMRVNGSQVALRKCLLMK